MKVRASSKLFLKRVFLIGSCCLICAALGDGATSLNSVSYTRAKQILASTLSNKTTASTSARKPTHSSHTIPVAVSIKKIAGNDSTLSVIGVFTSTNDAVRDESQSGVIQDNPQFASSAVGGSVVSNSNSISDSQGLDPPSTNFSAGVPNLGLVLPASTGGQQPTSQVATTLARSSSSGAAGGSSAGASDAQAIPRLASTVSRDSFPLTEDTSALSPAVPEVFQLSNNVSAISDNLNGDVVQVPSSAYLITPVGMYSLGVESEGGIVINAGSSSINTDVIAEITNSNAPSYTVPQSSSSDALAFGVDLGETNTAASRSSTVNVADTSDFAINADDDVVFAGSSEPKDTVAPAVLGGTPISEPAPLALFFLGVAWIFKVHGYRASSSVGIA